MSRSCPACDSNTHRVARKGRLEACLSLFFVYPFRCKLCSHRFRALRWGFHYGKLRFNRRGQRRLRTDFPVTLSWGQKQAEGRIIDISLSGCRLQSAVSLGLDNFLTLLLQAPGFRTGIRVESAQVRRVGTTVASLSFLRMGKDEKRRLCKLLFTLTGIQTGDSPWTGGTSES